MATRESELWTLRSALPVDPARVGDILAAEADVALVVDGGGIVRSVVVNPATPDLGRLKDWEGRPIAESLAPDSRAKVSRQLIAVVQDASNRPAAIEVNHADGAAWDAPVRYTVHATGRAPGHARGGAPNHARGGDGVVVMLGRDLRPITEMQQSLLRAQAAAERGSEAQRVHETRFRVLLDAARDGFVFVEMASGRVTDANARAAALLGTSVEALRGASLAQEFEGRRRGELLDALASGAGRGPHPVAAARTGAPLALHPSVFRGGGERVLMLRVEEADGAEAAPTEAAARLSALYDAAPDAMAFVDGDGLIVDANDAFLSLVDLDALADLRGRVMADFLVRGVVDMRVLTQEPLARIYATRLVSAYGTQVAVEMAPAAMPGGGYGFVMREADRTQPVREAPEDRLDPAIENARGLVGSAALRDIVASMTDVIEKECIEAAVEMTNNNRVAAAEMLGLSRQSLYVKLRKFGLLSRGE